MAAQDTAHQLQWRYGDVDDSNFAVRGSEVPLLVGLLLLVACFVALSLYLRWACHLHSPDASSASSPAAAAPSIQVTGMDAATISTLPVTLYRPAEAPDAEAGQCSICIGELVEGEKVKSLQPCGHCFHLECVDAWLRSRASCPLCRGTLLAAATKSDAASLAA